MGYFGEGVLDLIELGNGLIKKTDCPLNARFPFYSEDSAALSDLHLIYFEGTNFIEKFLLETGLNSYLKMVMKLIPNLSDNLEEVDNSINNIVKEVLSEAHVSTYAWRLFHIPFSQSRHAYKNCFIILSEIVKPNHIRVCVCFTGDSAHSKQYFDRVCVLSALNEMPNELADKMTRH